MAQVIRRDPSCILSLIYQTTEVKYVEETHKLDRDCLIIVCKDISTDTVTIEDTTVQAPKDPQFLLQIINSWAGDSVCLRELSDPSPFLQHLRHYMGICKQIFIQI